MANVSKQELVSGETKATRTWPREYQWKNGIIFDKMNTKQYKQSLIHKAENLLEKKIFTVKTFPAGFKCILGI